MKNKRNFWVRLIMLLLVLTVGPFACAAIDRQLGIDLQELGISRVNQGIHIFLHISSGVLLGLAFPPITRRRILIIVPAIAISLVIADRLMGINLQDSTVGRTGSIIHDSMYMILGLIIGKLAWRRQPQRKACNRE